MNILIIDDDPVSVAVIQEHVRCLENCRIISFASSYQALAWSERNEADLVIID
jgi:DNA-binding NarL/FixJ family response regulator